MKVAVRVSYWDDLWCNVASSCAIEGVRKVSFAGGSQGRGRHQDYAERKRRNRENSRRYQARLRRAARFKRELECARVRNTARLVEKEHEARVLGGVLSGASRRRG